MQTQIREYEKVIRENVKGDLLDLGCGDVPFYGIYKELVDSVTCVDWKKSNNDIYLDYKMDLNKKLELKSGSFNTVLMTDVFEHIAEPKSLLQEVNRVLRKGGKLILTVPFFYWLHRTPHDYHRYTRYALEYYCQESGLKVISLYPYGGLMDVFADLINKIIKIYLRFPKIFVFAYCRLASLITSSRLGRKIYNSTSEIFPLGYILVAEK